VSVYDRRVRQGQGWAATVGVVNATSGQWDGWERLAPGVVRRRLPHHGLDVTVGVVVGTDRVLVVDTGSTRSEGEELRRRATGLAGGRPVTDVALTHGHFDHVLGASAFPGARLHSAWRPAGPEALGAEAVSYGVDPAEADASARALVRAAHAVEQVAGEPRELDLGGGRRALLVHPGEGHTGHDLVVVVPGTPCVVFCGDLVEESGEPQAGPDTVPGAWPGTLDRLAALGGPEARYVPGHGAVVDTAFVRGQRAGLAARFGVA
jgi:glyoxylase-like metal-dependent hydrolase (beta-lactamase superfamily II)